MRLVVWVGVAVVLLMLLRAAVVAVEPKLAFYPLRGIQETPRDLGIPYEQVALVTDDGERVYGWWLPQERARADVIFWHGNGGNLSLWLDVVAGVHQRGFAVFAAEYRGYGNCSGRPTEQGIYRDADATLDDFWNRRRSAGRPTIYWGRSLGSVVAAYAASKKAPDALVLESPFPSKMSLLMHYPVMAVFGMFSAYRFPTGRFLQNFDRPILVVHGRRDTIIPFAQGRKLFEALTGPKEMLVLDGANHNDLHVADPAAYWAGIERFVERLQAARRE